MMFTSRNPNLDVTEGDIAIEMVLETDTYEDTYVESSRQLLVVGVNPWSRSVEVLLRENKD
jgi:hypothetical protein